MLSGTIYLSEIKVICRIGTDIEERSTPQELIIDASLKCDIENAAIHDRISEAVNYVVVEQKIRNIAETAEYRLLEKLALKICRELLTLDKVFSVQLKISKFPRVFEGRLDRVSLELGPIEAEEI